MKGGPSTELWDTTYNDYGRFYKGAKLEDAAQRCEKKCEKLSRELKECQRKLEDLRLKSQSTETAGPSRRGLKDMLRYQSAVPNLRVSQDSDDEDRKSPYWKRAQEEVKKLMETGKGQGFGGSQTARAEDVAMAYRYKQLFPSEYNMEYKEFQPAEVEYVGFDLPPPPPPRSPDERPAPLHPSVNRYSHYKFYGYGGHGAKTSWGHNLPLGRGIKHCKRHRNLPQF